MDELLAEIRILEHRLTQVESETTTKLKNDVNSKIRLPIQNLLDILKRDDMDADTKLRKMEINLSNMVRYLKKWEN